MNENRVKEYITKKEAHCPCGCGLLADDKVLDRVNTYIRLCGFSVPISCIVRCIIYNSICGGVDDSPHLGATIKMWACDLKQQNAIKRMRMVIIAVFFYLLKIINQIEICDKHIHIAKVPEDHRLAGMLNWGKSR